MSKVARVSSSDRSKVVGYSFECPGCKSHHLFYTEPWDSGSYVDGKWVPKKGPVWSFNGNMDRPTFSPSLLIYEGKWDDGTVAHPRCHSFVRDGRIQFLNDCGHNLAGQTVELPDIV